MEKNSFLRVIFCRNLINWYLNMSYLRNMLVISVVFFIFIKFSFIGVIVVFFDVSISSINIIIVRVCFVFVDI